MGTIQDMVKKAANKISDEVNKNKWDHNSINSALFMNDSTPVPPNPSAAKPAFQQAGTAAAVPVNNTAPAPTPAPASMGSVPVAAQAGINTPSQTPAAPAAAAPAPAPQPAPVQNGYVKPVFRSRFAGPVKTTQQSNSLATLPTVDPSQKISNIGTEAAAVPAPAADSVPASAQAPVQAVPAQAIPAQPVTMQATPVQTAAAPVQATPIQAAPVQTMPGQPNPVLGTAAPAAQPAVSTPAQSVAPVAPVTEYCYYVQIKHTKTFPAPGSVVLMRSCDHEYVWTNEKSEADKVSYSTCPHCGKTVSNTSVEMD